MSRPNERTPGAMGIEGRALREVDTTIVRDAAGDDKRFNNVRASACLAGHELQRQDNGTFAARRWGWSRAFLDPGAVEVWLAGITGNDPSRRERERRALIDEANRHQDALDEQADLLRGPGGAAS